MQLLYTKMNRECKKNFKLKKWWGLRNLEDGSWFANLLLYNITDLLFLSWGLVVLCIGTGIGTCGLDGEGVRRRWSLIGKKSRSHAVVSLLTRTQYLLAQIPDTLSSAFPSSIPSILLLHTQINIRIYIHIYICIHVYTNVHWKFATHESEPAYPLKKATNIKIIQNAL